MHDGEDADGLLRVGRVDLCLNWNEWPYLLIYA
jgi:hypothetical protein